RLAREPNSLANVSAAATAIALTYATPATSGPHDEAAMKGAATASAAGVAPFAMTLRVLRRPPDLSLTFLACFSEKRQRVAALPRPKSAKRSSSHKKLVKRTMSDPRTN